MDIILQSIGRNGTKDISFTVPKSSLESAISILDPYVETIGANSIVYDDRVVKVSIVGAAVA